MHKNFLETYRCPKDGTPLALADGVEENGQVISGKLVSANGSEYLVQDGIPDLIFPEIDTTSDKEAADFYDGRVDAYDENLHLTFKTHGQDENTVRNGFIDLLQLKPDSTVIEVAAGTGRDSVLIAERLSGQGAFCISDISRGMLRKCKQKFDEGGYSVPVDFHLSNAINLPFKDQSFDALYCFGALSEVSDVKKTLAEMVRVCKIGARVVVGATCVAPWLRDTDYAKILITTNPFFETELPVNDLPVEARDVCIRWGIGYAYYLIDFTVGEGEPEANFDFPIPGERGGTYRTRYEGQLEGVTLETKRLAYEARKASGKSMHEWLDEAVREKARQDLEGK